VLRRRAQMPATYAPASRLQMTKALLNHVGGATLRDLMERLSVSKQTAYRYLHALEGAGEAIEEQERDGEKAWRIVAARATETLKVTLNQMIALYMSSRMLGCFAGTGIDDDLQELLENVRTTIVKRDYDAAKNLHKKFFDVGEARHIYDDRIDDMNDAITALLKEEKLLVSHTSIDRGRVVFEFEPYCVVTYKKGLYLAGKSHHHGAIRTFALGGFTSIEWQRGQRFVYPEDFDPAKLVEGAWGMIRHEVETHVRIRFSWKVARYVERRMWHPSQKIEKGPDGIVLSLDVFGTVELVSWVLSFGPTAEVLGPQSLRDEVREELRRALAPYGESPADLGQ
jgi:predicted DNA-binding transcriptional regulator YafY